MRFAKLAVVAALLPASGCHIEVNYPAASTADKGSGVAKEETRQVEPFTAVEVSAVIEATVAPGPEVSVKVSGDDNLVPLVVTEVRDGTLSVGIKSGANVSPKLPLKAEIRAPKVAAVSASGAAHLTAKAGEAPRYAAGASGAARVTVEGISADEVKLGADGAGRVTASGQTRALKVDASGAAQVEADGLRAETAQVSLSGAAKGSVHATRSVRGDASGAARLHVLDRPESRDVSTSGAAGVDYPSGR